MFDFLKRKKNTDETVTTDTSEPAPAAAEPPIDAEPKTKAGFFARLKQGLAKTRASFTTGISNLFLGKKTLDAETLAEIETLLLTADVGFETTQQLISTLTQKLARNELADTQAALLCLQEEMKKILQPASTPLTLSDQHRPFVILVVGVNGSGKTTTIGKLAHYFQKQGKNIILAAGDTFRAAAIEQLQVWGERNQIPVIAQQPGADTAAVIYDAMEAAKARHYDVLLADTAGRLHTQSGLMAELQKVNRVLAKLDPTAPHETLIVLDATLGQNALNQVKQFHQTMRLTGIVLTKLDGTAKGGIIFALAKQTGIPIRFIGLGEGIHDLRPFNPDEFVDALFSTNSSH